MFGRPNISLAQFDFPGALHSMCLANALPGSITMNGDAEKAVLVLLSSLLIEQQRTNELLERLVYEAEHASARRGA